MSCTKSLCVCMTLYAIVLTALVCILHVACINPKIAIKRELGLLRSTLSFQSNSISKATPPCIATPTSACSIIGGMRPVPLVLSQHHPLSATSISSGSKGHLSGSGKLRPLSLPKPTIILPFSHSKTMTILKDGNMRPVPTCTLLHACNNKIKQLQKNDVLPLPPAPHTSAPLNQIP